MSDGVRRQAFTKLHFKVMGLTRSKALRPKTRGGDAFSAATFRAIFLIGLTQGFSLAKALGCSVAPFHGDLPIRPQYSGTKRSITPTLQYSTARFLHHSGCGYIECGLEISTDSSEDRCLGLQQRGGTEICRPYQRLLTD